MIETMLKYLSINAIVIIITFCCLLPFEVKKKIFTIVYLLPIPTSGENFSYQLSIVASA